MSAQDTASSGPADRPGPLPAFGRHLFRLTGALVFVVGSVTAVTAASRADRPLVLALALLGLACAVVALVFRLRAVWLFLDAIIAFALLGDLMLVLVPASLGWLPTLIAVPLLVLRAPGRLGFWLGGAVGAVLVAMILNGSGAAAAIGLVGGVFGTMALGWTIRREQDRADGAERLLASEKAAREAIERAGVLAERQRLAREIHDILAHTLSAQVVQLEGARLLIRRGAPAADVLARVEQSQKLARDGLDETRRALDSLRGRTRPLDTTLRRLAEPSGAAVTITGTVRPVEPEVAVALERTVQEALTNVRKHANGARVTVRLDYGADGCAVEVTDTGGTAGHPDVRDRAQAVTYAYRHGLAR